MKTFKHKNISVEYNASLTSFGYGNNAFIILPSGKIIEKSPLCPRCRCKNCRKNGYYEIEHRVIRELGIDAKNGQYECKNCGCHFHTNRSLIDSFIDSITDFIKSLLKGCAKCKMTYETASSLVEERIGVSYSGEYVRQLYNEACAQITEERTAEASGVYHYDEQFLLVDGVEVCRLTIKDAVTGKIICDTQTEDAKEETIKKVFRHHLNGLKVDCFILDLASRYLNILHELFPKAKIQWCIFHLYRLIWKELIDDYGRSVPLHELYNVYLLFDIFFNHDPELKKLKELMKHFESQKTKCEKVNNELEKALRKTFSKFVHEQKKERRRNKQNVPRRTLEESEKRFTLICSQNRLYTKKISKRIEYIKENWENFTLFQRDSRVPPTNNGIEQYFAATLSKTEKKDFRSRDTIARDLRIFKAEWNGVQIFNSKSLITVIKEMMFLLRAFAPR